MTAPTSKPKPKALLQKSTMMKPKEREEQLTWFHFDATGQTLGRLASQIATVLKGKHRPEYNPSLAGDGVIVTNVEKIVVTGNKEAQMKYRSYSGFIGGVKEVPYRTMMDRHPDRILRHAVLGMLPRNRLRNSKFEKRLRLFAGAEHTMQKQNPVEVKIPVDKA